MSGSGRSGSHRQIGFTLVEMLLAITLMSMLLGLAYGGLRAAIRSADRGQEILQEAGQLRSTHQFVRRQLGRALPLAYAVSSDAEDARIVFEGNSRRVQYVSAMPGYLGSGGPQVQVLELTPGDDGQDLLFSHTPLQNFDTARLFDRDPILLLDDIADATFSFLGRDEEGKPANWMTNWDDPATLPAAIQIAIEFNDGGKVVWPTLFAAVRIDAQAVSGAGAASHNRTIQDLINDSRDPE
jgi:general secretion pathway protein J